VEQEQAKVQIRSLGATSPRRTMESQTNIPRLGLLHKVTRRKPSTRTRRGIAWCGMDTGGKCKKWRRHSPKECTFGTGGSAENKRSADDGNNKKAKKESKKLKITKAYSGCIAISCQRRLHW
jgi:hypothetical protein